MYEYIIISVSARALAESASKAGYNISVIDSFSDKDTQLVSNDVHKVSYNSDGFNETELLSTIKNILVTSPNAVLLLGTGFESTPDLIKKLKSIAPVLSNSRETINVVKNPVGLSKILGRHGIEYPQTQLNKPDVSKKFLRKKIAGQGGDHISWYENESEIPDSYFQEFISGDVYSALFIANGKNAKLIGVNQQLQSDDFNDLPFLYKGAIKLNRNIIKNIESIDNIIKIITTEGNLTGLCGLDYINRNNSEVVVLEVNPRPPATFELYEQQHLLFNAHIASFNGELINIDEENTDNEIYNGHAILYAKHDLIISGDMSWPEWTKDIPQAKTIIHARHPVCSVHAKENSIDKTKAMLFNRLSQIEAMIEAAR